MGSMNKGVPLCTGVAVVLVTATNANPTVSRNSPEESFIFIFFKKRPFKKKKQNLKGSMCDQMRAITENRMSGRAASSHFSHCVIEGRLFK